MGSGRPLGDSGSLARSEMPMVGSPSVRTFWSALMRSVTLAFASVSAPRSSFSSSRRSS